MGHAAAQEPACPTAGGIHTPRYTAEQRRAEIRVRRHTCSDGCDNTRPVCDERFTSIESEPPNSPTETIHEYGADERRVRRSPVRFGSGVSPKTGVGARIVEKIGQSP
jgi:hypothetical protein